MKLTKSKPEDIAIITEISTRAFNSDAEICEDGMDGPPDYDNIEWHITMMNEGHLYTAVQKGVIVGGVVLFEEKKALYIVRIFVKPELFDRGYGTMIMSEIEQMFKSYDVIRAQTSAWNDRTNSFYKKNGYRISGRDEEMVFFEKKIKCPAVIC